jgi:hypothetical protein
MDESSTPTLETVGVCPTYTRIKKDELTRIKTTSKAKARCPIPKRFRSEGIDPFL